MNFIKRWLLDENAKILESRPRTPEEDELLRHFKDLQEIDDLEKLVK